MKGSYYNISEGYQPNSTSSHFQLHTHEEYELFLFLEGDASYIVEDMRYPLHPGDIIIIRKNELHRVFHHSNAPYRRIPLHISPAFFTAYHCEEYEARFLDTTPGNNQIPAGIVHSSGLYDTFMKLKKYSGGYTTGANSPIMIALLIEIFYMINQLNNVSSVESTDSPVAKIILYLNEHFTEDISLTMLEEKFFISKYYLCKTFRKATGLTLQEYVRLKRLALAKDLRANGANISEAATAAGFKDYSAFYRAYKKEFGSSPREDL